MKCLKINRLQVRNVTIEDPLTGWSERSIQTSSFMGTSIAYARATAGITASINEGQGGLSNWVFLVCPGSQLRAKRFAK